MCEFFGDADVMDILKALYKGDKTVLEYVESLSDDAKENLLKELMEDDFD